MGLSSVLIKGFDVQSDAHPSGQLQWYCAPDTWPVDSARREGQGGSWAIADNSLTIAPPAKKDFWRKTYYEPILVKDDGPFLFAELDASKYCTISTLFVLTAASQFDQAGIMIRLDAEHWLKTGIEVVDGDPRLSCVVTNGYSDWSTQAYPASSRSDKITTVEASLRVHYRGASIVVEAQRPNGDWEFVRIAHLSRAMNERHDALASYAAPWHGPSPEEGRVWAGVFACSPEDQRGGSVTFTDFQIVKGSVFAHHADGNQELVGMA